LRCAPSTFDAVERYLSRVFDSSTEIAATDVLTLLDDLASENIFEPSLKAGISIDEDPRLVALWQELASAYARADTRPSLKRIAMATAMSLRNISRFMTLASRELLLPPGGWRDTTVNLRLTMAVLFLSCPAISIADVAKALGYGHAEAMANAFQRAGLRSPTDARAAALEHA
jgi:AraC-like DNA-binding protein